jgi:hypothetical protein
LDLSSKSIVSKLLLSNSHTTLGPDLLVIHTPLISHSSATSCKALCTFHFAHSTLALVSIGTGTTWPFHQAPHGTVVCWSPAILAFSTPIPFSPSHIPAILLRQVWPLATQVRHLPSASLLRYFPLVLQVFSRGCPRENFLTLAMGSTHSKIPSDSPLGCLLHNLIKLDLKGDLKPKILTHLSTEIWPQYKLDNSSKWPEFGIFVPNVLQDLDNFIVKNGKWQEVPYLQAFFYLISRPFLCSNCFPFQILLLNSHPSPSAPKPLPSPFD